MRQRGQRPLLDLDLGDVALREEGPQRPTLGAALEVVVDLDEDRGGDLIGDLRGTTSTRPARPRAAGGGRAAVRRPPASAGGVR